MHLPGLEPGSPPWKGGILPLDHKCFLRYAKHIDTFRLPILLSFFLFDAFPTFAPTPFWPDIRADWRHKTSVIDPWCLWRWHPLDVCMMLIIHWCPQMTFPSPYPRPLQEDEMSSLPLTSQDPQQEEEDDDDRRAEYLGYDDHPPSYFSLSRWHSHVMPSN